MTGKTPDAQRILGTLRSDNGVGVVRIEDRFDFDQEEVWAALTTPKRLAQWYGDVEGELRVGGEVRLHVFTSGWRGTRQITGCDPPRHLSFVSKQAGDSSESAVEITLAADGGRTVIVYEHRGVPLDLLFAYGAGEQIHVEDLRDHLAGRDRDASESRWDALEPAYRELASKIE